MPHVAIKCSLMPLALGVGLLGLRVRPEEVAHDLRDRNNVVPPN
jgi:hypothetical protein